MCVLVGALEGRKIGRWEEVGGNQEPSMVKVSQNDATRSTHLSMQSLALLFLYQVVLLKPFSIKSFCSQQVIFSSLKNMILEEKTRFFNDYIIASMSRSR